MCSHNKNAKNCNVEEFKQIYMTSILIASLLHALISKAFFMI